MSQSDLWAPVVRALGAPLGARWEGSPYLRHLHLLKRTQYDPPDVVRERQWRAVSEQLRHAYTSTLFWREHLDRAGIRPDRVRSFDDYRAVPLLTKDDLRTHGPRLLSDRYAGAALHRKKTSGSTGVSLEVLVDEESMQWKRACTLRSDEWSGWRFGEPVAKVWGNPDYLRRGWRGRLRNALLERASYLDTLHLTEAALAAFARQLPRRPPSLLFGPAPSPFLLAPYLS